MKVNNVFSIPDEEILITFVHAAGPGGQNVNKTASAAQLRFDVRNSPSFPGGSKGRLEQLAGRRMTQDGILIIEARRYRTQERNRRDAEERLAALLQRALTVPKKRKLTHPSPASKAERTDTKKRRGTVKRMRQKPLDLDA
jgi:ribosome-associated protein